MRKWIVIVIATLIGVVLIGYWLLAHVFVVYTPRGGLYHIETPGGPVPIDIIIYDRDWVVVQVGYDERVSLRFTEQTMAPVQAVPKEELVFDPPRPEQRFEYKLRRFRPKSNSFVLSFQNNNAKLVIGPSSGESGERVGEFIVRDRTSKKESVFPVTRSGSHYKNWFELNGEVSTEKPSSDFQGKWLLTELDQRTSGLLEINLYDDLAEETELNADAALASFLIEHRTFAGRVVGSRIRLASLDYAYPALIDATIQDDGTLKGDLWVGDSVHESFVGVRVDD